VLVEEIFGDKMCEVVIALRGIKNRKLLVGKVDRKALRIVCPRPNLYLNIRVRLSGKAEKC
jgi:hypothetical protein